MDLSNHIQEEIFKAIQGLRYGSVEVVVHDSEIVQIERKRESPTPWESHKNKNERE